MNATSRTTEPRPPRPDPYPGPAAAVLPPLSLLDQVADLRSGRLDLPTHVERLLTRIDRLDPAVHAFVPEPGRYRRLAAEARDLAARDPADLPLYGAAVGVKDVLHVAGLPTHAGSALPPGVLAGPEAAAVTRLRAAGALIAGKTVTTEFALTAPGPTRNPRALTHTPGGSSSGSAAAVAAGLLPLALGTQTLGSVIRPAAYCGVLGFRPTHGRIPTTGLLPNSPTLDAVGCFTADLPSLQLAAALLCDDWSPPAGAPNAQPVLGVPTGRYLDQVDPDALTAFTRHLADLGVTVRHVDALPDLDDLTHHATVIHHYELAHRLGELVNRFGALLRPETAAAIRRGQDVDRADYLAALAAREGFRHRLTGTMSDHHLDLFATPAAPGPAPLGLDSTGSPALSLPWSHAGFPALTLPTTLTPLPLGLQLIAHPHADEALLHTAAHLQHMAD
ncbi:amidase [Kitasatospora sp. NPDC049285]|uniref:amidase n=1 Tax=Kitasatospora sp. NPDC049285 TaxID=3157096 RepID=UPI00342ADC96